MHPMFTPAQYNLLWRILSESPVESPEKDEIMRTLADIRHFGESHAELERALNEHMRAQDRGEALPQETEALLARIDQWVSALPDTVAHEGVRLQTLATFILG